MSRSLGGGITPIAGGIYCGQFVTQVPLTISTIRLYPDVGAAGNIDVGVYAATNFNSYPKTLLGHSGAIAAAGGSIQDFTMLSVIVLAPGKYWFAYVNNANDTVWGKTSQPGLPPGARSDATTFTTLQDPAPAMSRNTTIIMMWGLVPGGFQ